MWTHLKKAFHTCKLLDEKLVIGGIDRLQFSVGLVLNILLIKGTKGYDSKSIHNYRTIPKITGAN